GVPRITVNWVQSVGTGRLAATSSVTDSAGLASVGYTLGDSAGSATITASIAGVAASASFTVTAIGNPLIALSPNVLRFTGAQAGGNPSSQAVTITNDKNRTL